MNFENVYSRALAETKELFVPNQIDIAYEISSSDFLRSYVARNVPILIKGGCTSWPAYKLWNRNYLIKAVTNQVTIAVTPNGLADSVVDGKFMLPYEFKSSLQEYFSYMGPLAYYCQFQNDGLNSEFVEVAADCFEHSWAQEAFGRRPDATNMWIGSDNATTSCHRDPYENIYSVVTGKKIFTLLPPIATPLLKKETFDAYRYDSEMNKISEGYSVPWVTVDPDKMDQNSLEKIRPLTVRVDAGDVLYLPSMWYHKVKQEGECIAVNHWYDMEYDSRYFLSLLLDSLKF